MERRLEKLSVINLHAEIRGDLTGISGDLTGISGNVDLCHITDAERATGVRIEDLIKSV